MNTLSSDGQDMTRRGQTMGSSCSVPLAIVTFSKGKAKKLAVDNLLNYLFKQFVKEKASQVSLRYFKIDF